MEETRIMLRTLQWHGHLIVTGSETTVLLALESILSNGQGCRLILGGSQSLRRMQNRPQRIADSQSYYILTNPMWAGVISALTGERVCSIPSDRFFLNFISIAFDQRCNVLVIVDTDIQENELKMQFAQLSMKIFRTNSPLSNENLFHAVVKSQARIVINCGANQDIPSYQETTAEIKHELLWIDVNTKTLW